MTRRSKRKRLQGRGGGLGVVLGLVRRSLSRIRADRRVASVNLSTASAIISTVMMTTMKRIVSITSARSARLGELKPGAARAIAV